MGLRVFRKQTAGGGGSGSPGGTSGQIQFNNAGAFGGISASGTGNIVRTTAMDTAIAAAITASEMVQVDTHADLPVTVGTPAVGTLYYVRTSTSSYWVFNKKPSGIWRRATNDGDLDDWVRAGDLADILPPIATQAEAEAGTGTAILSWTPERVKQAILAFLTWSNVSGKPSTFAPSAHTHPASEISDSTTTGRAVMVAADAAAARTAIDAEATQTAASQAEAEAGSETAIRKFSPLRIFQAIAARLTLGTWISGATGKTTPVDADLLPISDSAASNGLKKVAFSDLKTWMQAYLVGLVSDGQFLKRSGSALVGDTPSGGGANLLGTTTSSSVVISNSNTITTIFSVTVPGGTLGTQGAVGFLLHGQFTNVTGSAQTITLTIEFDGVVMYADATPNIASSGTPRTWNIEGILFADNSASAQRLAGTNFTIGPAVGAATGYGDLAGSPIIFFAPAFGGTQAADSTVDKTLAIRMTLSAASANFSVTLHKASAWKKN